MQNNISQFNKPKPSWLTVTNTIIAVCVVVYGVLQAQYGRDSSGFELYFSDNQNHKIWQYVSHMFLHGSTQHLLFNMFGLWMFGSALEKVWGSQRFLVFYLISGLGAAFIYMQVNKFQLNGAMESILASGFPSDELNKLLGQGMYRTDMPLTKEATSIFNGRVVGASGALYGILAAFAFLFPNHKIALIFLPVPIAAKYFVPAILGLDLFSGVTGFSIFGGNIAHFAHIGGALVGALLTVVWYKRAKQKAYHRLGMWHD